MEENEIKETEAQTVNVPQEAAAAEAESSAEETRHYRESIEQHNRDMATTEKKQLKYQKLAFVFSMLSAVFMGVMLAVVIAVAAFILPKVETIYDSTMVSLQNLETLTDELNEADIAGTVRHVDELTVQATGDLSETMERMNRVDLDTLNDAITNLNASVEPLAKFFGAMPAK